MSHSPDRELLHRYAHRGDTEAFAALVNRHIGFVYAAARRQTRDSHLADDVTQAVFLVLARRAGTIRSDLAMTTWLFGVTRRACQNALKLQSRRRFHEKAAAAQHAEELRVRHDDVSDVRALLDDAIGHLPKCDQGGVIMHFFGNFSYAQVGCAMGTSADAARKRIERALDKMKQFLSRRGIADSSAVLSASIARELAVRPAASLVESTTNVAVLATTESLSASTPTLSIAQHITRTLVLAKLKLATAGAVAATLMIGLPLLARISALPFTSIATVAVAMTAPATAPSVAPLKIDPDPKTSVEILGAAKLPADDDGWISPTGVPLPDPEDPFADLATPPQWALDAQVLLRLRHPKSTLISTQIIGSAVDASADRDPRATAPAPTTAPADDGDVVKIVRVVFRLQKPADRFGMRFYVTDQPWKTLLTNDAPGDQANFQSEKFGEFRMQPIRQQEDHAVVDVEYAEFPGTLRLFAIDAQGVEHVNVDNTFNTDGHDVVANFILPLPPEQVAKLRLEIRPFTNIIEVTNLAFSRGVTTVPVVKITKLEK
jgi:RNA polymerase sigma factor (sigma-70 family)